MAKSQQDGQQKQPGQGLLKIFPVFFGFISFTLPAGLVVYFAASQIFRIGQQALILRMDGGRAVESPPRESERKPEDRPKQSQVRPSNGREPGKPAPRRPQGSKKGRGKRRRRK
jgi:membrane protein insertase Oxa1/YidC/SpoIIIJ